MSIIMDKELLIRLPSTLYKRVKRACDSEYKSISAFVRELLLERLDDTLSTNEMKIIEKERTSFNKGKGTAWRKVKRG